ncbi:hypothetical protein HFN49_18055 [Rhizobium leguminosarum]|uniref:hypothetical protein n=1 Tax=Rhizobium ruizarguesonis TaxID=2081791 RepID=UPI001A996BB5|nr:hypothetical protein [Rhizobium ruizarguesonis]MBY5888087.1 hypothetical protein [Rhizobium leguminosarum]QSZ02924.1 hypothetical protein J3P73_10810 [Rhizobium ruizarguesonis]
MTGKREPGAGRKPNGEFSGKSAVFSTRITPDLRALLEKESKQTGKSLSQIVERRLRDSFDQPDRWKRALGAEHVRALAYVVAKIATSLEIRTGRHWHKDAFTGSALKTALNIAMHYFGSWGEVRVPDRLEEQAARMQAASPGADFGKFMKDPADFGAQRANEFVAGIEFLETSNIRRSFIGDSEAFQSDEALAKFIVGTLQQGDEQ